MDSPFLNIARGNRLTLNLNLKMAEGYTFKYSPDYTYVEIPLLAIEDKDGAKVEQASRNQQVKLLPAASVEVRGGFKGLVKINPALQEYGVAPSMLLLDNGEKESLSFYVQLRKDLRIDDLKWIVRVYLLV